jgi:hypothetical protein
MSRRAIPDHSSSNRPPTDLLAPPRSRTTSVCLVPNPTQSVAVVCSLARRSTSTTDQRGGDSDIASSAAPPPDRPTTLDPQGRPTTRIWHRPAPLTRILLQVELTQVQFHFLPSDPQSPFGLVHLLELLVILIDGVLDGDGRIMGPDAIKFFGMSKLSSLDLKKVLDSHYCGFTRATSPPHTTTLFPPPAPPAPWIDATPCLHRRSGYTAGPYTDRL